MNHHSPQPDAWSHLRHLTSARIALGRAGGSLPTRQLLDFSRAHAAARDAVHQPFEPGRITEAIAGLGLGSIVVASRAPDRATYLRRPDLGRAVDSQDQLKLQAAVGDHAIDLVIVVSDGLSATAAHEQAAPLLAAWSPLLRQREIRVAPVVVVRFGRVAIQDPIGQALRASVAVILIGERPGLGTPDSLGVYLVHRPFVGNTDAQRNCVSNIHRNGLSPAAAAQAIHWLVCESIHRKISGVGLKDDRAAPVPSTCLGLGDARCSERRLKAGETPATNR